MAVNAVRDVRRQDREEGRERLGWRVPRGTSHSSIHHAKQRGDDMKILVGYDGSDAAKGALSVAGRHVTIFGGSIEVVSILTESRDTPYPDTQGAQCQLQRDVGDMLNRSNVSYSAHVVVTDLSPAEGLMAFAERNSVDEIVVGTGETEINGALLLGRNAQHLFLNSPTPVATVNAANA